MKKLIATIIFMGIILFTTSLHAQIFDGGDLHSIMLCKDSTVWTCGNNGKGQLGNSTMINDSVPIQVFGPGGVGFLDNIVAVAAEQEQCLTLRSDGTVWSWGANNFGQLGIGGTTDVKLPSQVLGSDSVGFIDSIVAISSGYYHSMALKKDGTVWAWGSNTLGQLGDGTYIKRYYPVQVKGITKVIAISAGAVTSLALRNDGTVWAWGSNDKGALGQGSAGGKDSLPIAVKSPGGTGFLDNTISIATNGSQSVGRCMVLRNDGRLWGWGKNNKGQLGNGTTTDYHLPTLVSTLTDVAAFAIGPFHSLAIKKDSTTWAWGSNFYGKLGIGTTSDTTLPVKITFFGDILTLAVGAGWGHSLAVNYSNTIVLAWGSNYSGQLGDSTTIDHSITIPNKLSCMVDCIPKTNFGYKDSSLTIDFLNFTLNTFQWSWDFGDGNISSDHSPSHAYSTPGTYQVCLTATNLCGSTTYCDSVSVLNTGIKDYLSGESMVRIYPNPVSSSATIVINIPLSREVGSASLMVYDLLGKEVKRIDIDRNTVEIKRVNLPGGMYIYKLTNEKGTIGTGKLIIE